MNSHKYVLRRLSFSEKAWDEVRAMMQQKEYLKKKKAEFINFFRKKNQKDVINCIWSDGEERF